MATLVSKPGAMEFLTYVTNEKDMVDIGFEEIRYEDMPVAIHGKSLEYIDVGPATGTHIIGLIRPDGTFVVNPAPDERLIEGSSMITLGTRDQLDRLQLYLDKFRSGAGK